MPQPALTVEAIIATLPAMNVKEPIDSYFRRTGYRKESWSAFVLANRQALLDRGLGMVGHTRGYGDCWVKLGDHYFSCIRRTK